MMFARRLDLSQAEDWRQAAGEIEAYLDYMQQMLELYAAGTQRRLRELEARVKALEG